MKGTQCDEAGRIYDWLKCLFAKALIFTRININSSVDMPALIAISLPL